MKNGYRVLSFLALIGLLDASFLTYEHYTLSFYGCPITPWINCLVVASSKYSRILGIPLALVGVAYYLSLLTFLLTKNKATRLLFVLLSTFGALFSFYLTYVQAFVLKTFCLYCLLSAAVSLSIFTVAIIFFEKEKNELILALFHLVYKHIVKEILFFIDAEIVHERMVSLGEKMARSKALTRLLSIIFTRRDKSISQKVGGVNFKTPIGLAAGFDYDAKLTQILPHLGFGFETVGTVTNNPYVGNPKPMLGRLPKSRSLMVNKGFKSSGAKAIAEKLKSLKFGFPLGISIGRTNSATLTSLEESIDDIVKAFKTFKGQKVKNSYFELNISCPNLIHAGSISFYPLKNLKKLLNAVDGLKLGKPLFIKMPIDQTDRHTINMLKEISQHKVQGVIIGNLQTNRKNKRFDRSELAKYKIGKFSGKPTFEDSNRLIKLVYQKFGDRLAIIGCGGVFNAQDAWVKFENGASLVQLITGMVFEGPQLIAQINSDLGNMLKRKGYKNIAQVVGSGVE